MKHEEIETIYRNFAEFHLRLHLTEIKTKYLPKMVEDAARHGFKEHYRIYRQELNEKLRWLIARDNVAIPELERIRKEYLKKFGLKALLN